MKNLIAIISIFVFFTGCTQSSYYMDKAQQSYHPAVQAHYFKLAQAARREEKTNSKEKQIYMAKGYGSFIRVLD